MKLSYIFENVEADFFYDYIIPFEVNYSGLIQKIRQGVSDIDILRDIYTVSKVSTENELLMDMSLVRHTQGYNSIFTFELIEKVKMKLKSFAELLLRENKEAYERFKTALLEYLDDNEIQKFNFIGIFLNLETAHEVKDIIDGVNEKIRSEGPKPEI